MLQRRLPILILAVFAPGACSDLATEPDRVPTELRISPDTMWLTEGNSAPFLVEVLDQHGEPYDRIPTWGPPDWGSSAPATIELDRAGAARALQAGESSVRVDVAGLSTDAVVRANPSMIDVQMPFVHVTQSVQRRAGDVPLVAGRAGLLRVYVMGGGVNFFRPTARALFYHGDELVHEMALTLESDGLPDEVDESDLRLSFDADVPGWVLQPGVGVVVEVDPDGVLPATAESVLRAPASGAMALDVRQVPTFRLRMVPVTQSVNGRTSRLTRSYAEQMTQLTRRIFPLGEMDMDVRAPYVTEAALHTPKGWYELIDEIVMLRWDDGSSRYYYGGFDRPSGTNIGGLGYVGYPVSIGMDDDPEVIAHELGHNLNLPHAPCGGVSGADPLYPHHGGRIGEHGYDAASRQLQSPTDTYDLMGYCHPKWISDYNYERVLAHRDTSEFDVGGSAQAPRASARAEGPVLLIRGGVLDGQLRIEPALEWNGPVTVPVRGGRYTVEGLDDAGAVLFDVSFEPRRLDHQDDAQFLMALPADMAHTDRLARLRLRGPEGVVERARSSGRNAPEIVIDRRGASAVGRWDPDAFPLAVIRDGGGAIRAMSRTGTITIPDGPGVTMDVLLSDGVATRAARVVQQ